MNTDDARFEAARILGNLGVSASELGYRAQALLAETLALMGGNALLRKGDAGTVFDQLRRAEEATRPIAHLAPMSHAPQKKRNAAENQKDHSDCYE